MGTVGPFFNDDFGSTFGIIYAFTADGFSFRELRDHVEAARSRLLQVPDVSEDRGAGRAGRADLHRVLHRAPGRPAPEHGRPSWPRCRRRTWCARPAPSRASRSACSCASPARSIPQPTSRAVNIVAGERIFRLGDIATVRRGYVDPPQPMFRVNGQPAIGLAIAMRDAGDILALGENVRREMADITANLPVGIEPVLVADQAVTVDVAINDFMTSLWQAIVIILACSFVSLGRAARHRGRAGDPADAGDRVRGDGGGGHRSPSHLAGCADHRAGPARRRRDDHRGRHDPAPRRWATPRTRRRPSPTARWPRRC